ncbi:SirA family protein [Thermanaerosceptrum fracticalcis]|uniref:SirA family protein n=1 Tax=Thermanaerosceptrum fracticalcis TaxID=1712410 RepID=A0A7G6E171_THEFR|nr:sulfurtransferase TusA family protein [Thermanaerosceptrum fracticalcis]QNB45825.1 SirA family protein [Thermanaerosceptrum fracticalcis]
MSQVVDARGLSCPEPLVLTTQAIKQFPSGPIKVIVDNASARDNVSRMAENLGWRVEIEKAQEEYVLALSK